MGYSHADSVVAGRFRGCLYCTPPGFAEATYAKWLGHSEAISRKHFVSPTDEEFSAAVRCRQESIPKIVPLNSRATKACTMTTSMSHHSLPEYIKSTDRPSSVRLQNPTQLTKPTKNMMEQPMKKGTGGMRCMYPIQTAA